MQIADCRIVMLDKTGTEIRKTLRGERRFAAAFVLADGSLLVSRTNGVCKIEQLGHVQRLSRNLRRGWIDTDTTRWDGHEMAKYFHVAVQNN